MLLASPLGSVVSVLRLSNTLASPWKVVTCWISWRDLTTRSGESRSPGSGDQALGWMNMISTWAAFRHAIPKALPSACMASPRALFCPSVRKIGCGMSFARRLKAWKGRGIKIIRCFRVQDGVKALQLCYTAPARVREHIVTTSTLSTAGFVCCSDEVLRATTRLSINLPVPGAAKANKSAVGCLCHLVGFDGRATISAERFHEPADTYGVGTQPPET